MGKKILPLDIVCIVCSTKQLSDTNIMVSGAIFIPHIIVSISHHHLLLSFYTSSKFNNCSAISHFLLLCLCQNLLGLHAIDDGLGRQTLVARKEMYFTLGAPFCEHALLTNERDPAKPFWEDF